MKYKKPKHLYIDGDMLLFAASSVAESVQYIYKIDGQEVARFGSASEGNNWIALIEAFGADPNTGLDVDVSKLERETEYEVHEFDKAKKAFDKGLKEFVKMSECDRWTCYISKATGHENFRYFCAKQRPYKGNRKSSRKPHWLEELRKYAFSIPNVKKSTGNVESDDWVQSRAQAKGELGLGLSGDKDLRTCVGCWFLIPGEMEKPVYSDSNIVGKIKKDGDKVKGYGWLFLLYQSIAGDSADNYGGCKGAGDAKAIEILKPYSGKSIDELENVVKDVCELYKKTYGEEFTFTNHHTGKPETVTWREPLIEMLHLAYMKKNTKDVCPLIEIVKDHK